jgi:hypothetical protein
MFEKGQREIRRQETLRENRDCRRFEFELLADYRLGILKKARLKGWDKKAQTIFRIAKKEETMEERLRFDKDIIGELQYLDVMPNLEKFYCIDLIKSNLKTLNSLSEIREIQEAVPEFKERTEGHKISGLCDAL